MSWNSPAVPIRGYPGKSPTPQGAYNPNIKYAYLDIVTYNGLPFISLAEGNKNNEPDNSPTWWMQLLYTTASTLLDGGAP